MGDDVHELLILLNLASPTPAQQARCKLLLENFSGWCKLFELAQVNQVVPLTLNRLLHFGAHVPSDLLEFSRNLQVHDRSRVVAAFHALQALEEGGINVCLLKGFLFGCLFYEPVAASSDTRKRSSQYFSYKKMNDIDILVHSSAFEPATKLLLELGFQPLDDFSGKDALSSKRHHNQTLVSATQDCVIGVHWRLTSHFARWQIETDRVWPQRVPIEITYDGKVATAFRLRWEDCLLHLCVQLPFFKTGLRELSDFLNLLIFTQDEFNWSVFNRLVEQAQAEAAAYRCLSLTQKLARVIGLNLVPDDLLVQWRERSPSFARQDTELKLKALDLLLRSRSIHTGRIEKAYIRFKLSSQRSEKLSTWQNLLRLILWPPHEELLRFSPGHQSLILKRLRAPAQIWRAMSQEYSSLALSMMLLYSCSSLLKSLLSRKMPAAEPTLHLRALDAFE